MPNLGDYLQSLGTDFQRGLGVLASGAQNLPANLQRGYEALGDLSPVDAALKLNEGAGQTLADMIGTAGHTLSIPKQAIRASVGIDPNKPDSEAMQDFGMPLDFAAKLGGFTETFGDPLMTTSLVSKGLAHPVTKEFVKDTDAALKIPEDILSRITSRRQALEAARRTIPLVDITPEPRSLRYDWTDPQNPVPREPTTVHQTGGPLPDAATVTPYMDNSERGFGGVALDAAGVPAHAIVFHKNSPSAAGEAAERLLAAGTGQHEVVHALHASAKTNPELIPYLSPEDQAVVRLERSIVPYFNTLGRLGSEIRAQQRSGRQLARIRTGYGDPTTPHPDLKALMENGANQGGQLFLDYPPQWYVDHFGNANYTLGEKLKSGELGQLYRDVGGDLTKFLERLKGRAAGEPPLPVKMSPPRSMEPLPPES